MFRNLFQWLFQSGAPGEGGDVSRHEDAPGDVQTESEETFENIVADEAAHDP